MASSSVPHLQDTGGATRRVFWTHLGPATPSHSVSSMYVLSGSPDQQRSKPLVSQPQRWWAESANGGLHQHTTTSKKLSCFFLLHFPRGFDWDDVFIEQPTLQTIPLPPCCAIGTWHLVIYPLEMEMSFWAETASLFAVAYHPHERSQPVFSLPTPLQ